MKNENTENQPAVTPEMAMAQVSQLYGENEEFRAEFDTDPRETLGKLSGSPMPEGTTVVVHHRQPKEIHIVLPDEDTMAAETTGEMSDEMLGQVSAAGFSRADWARISAGFDRYMQEGGFQGNRDPTDGSGYRPVEDRQGRRW